MGTAGSLTRDPPPAPEVAGAGTARFCRYGRDRPDRQSRAVAAARSADVAGDCQDGVGADFAYADRGEVMDPFPRYWWLQILAIGAVGAVIVWAVGKLIWWVMR